MVHDDGPVGRRNTAEMADWLLLPEVVRSRVRPMGRCLIWTGEVDRKGRGVIGPPDDLRLVAAVVWSYANDRHRKQWVVQVCENRLCCRPSHLADPGHPKKRSKKPVPDTCPAGHVFDAANTYISPEGYRECRTCARERMRARRRAAGPPRPNIGEVNAAKTMCPKGHPYDGDNLLVDSKGFRRCHACAREAKRAYLNRVKARKAGTHCLHGQPMTPENVYFRENGRRSCVACRRERNRRSRRRRRDAA